MENYKEYCRDYIIERLEDYNGNEYSDAYELANALTEYDNTNGSFTYSTFWAKAYVKHWFDQVGDFLDEYESEFGEKLGVNPFNDSEKFHGIMVIVGVEKMLSNLNCLPGEGFTLTEEFIESIKKELNELNINE